MKPDKPEQLKFKEFYKTNRGYLTILNNLVDSGQLKDITVYGLGILVVLKRFTHLFKTSREAYPYPSLTKISKVSGVSVSKVKSTIVDLINKGYIEKVWSPETESNRYMVKDQYLSIAQKEESHDKFVATPYLPARKVKTEREMDFWDQHGTIPEGANMKVQPVIIQNLNITYINNQNAGDVNVVTVVPQYDELLNQKKIPAWIKAKVKQFEESLNSSAPASIENESSETKEEDDD